MPDSPPSNRIESSREQVVEAMAYALVDRNADIADRNPAPTVWDKAADDSKAMLQAALSTGLLKLVKERPEKSMPPSEYGEPPLGEPWPEDEVDMAGHQPEGEPSEEALEESQRAYDAPENSRCRMEAALRTAYAIDHPQDR